MQSAPLLVTGSTGRLGGRVARRLAAAGVPQRLLVRDSTRAPQLDGVELVQGSYGDAAALREACKGIETVFMVSGSETPTRACLRPSEN